MNAWPVITSLVERMKIITQANGYQTDIGNAATDEPERVDDGVAGVLVATSTIDVTNADGSNRQRRDMTLYIEVRVPAVDGNGMEKAHSAIDDIERAIETMDVPPGPGRADYQLNTATFEDRPDGRNVILARWTATAVYRRDKYATN